MISDQNAFKVDCCSPKCEWAATAACFDRKMLLISTPSVPTMPIWVGCKMCLRSQIYGGGDSSLHTSAQMHSAKSTQYIVQGPIGFTYLGQFRQDGKNGQNLAFFKFFSKLCCDQNVWFLQLFSTVLMRFCPLQSKNVFVLVLAHLNRCTWLGKS